MKTKYQEGYLASEIKELLKEYPAIDMDKFNDAMMGHTCVMKDEGIVMYRHDVENAIKMGLK